LTLSGWVAAGDIEAGDKVYLYSGEGREVKEVRFEYLDTPIKVYNFEVEDWHTYFVSEQDVFVHNSCEGKGTSNTQLTFDEALKKLDKSGLRPGQTEISKSRVMEIVENYDPMKAQSSVYTDSTGRYLVEGHHTTVANTMLGKGSGVNMNIPTQQMPSATNVYWTKKWYEFWKTQIKVTK